MVLGAPITQCRAYESTEERCPSPGETFTHVYDTALCLPHKQAWRTSKRWPDGRRLVLTKSGDVLLIWAGYDGD